MNDKIYELGDVVETKVLPGIVKANFEVDPQENEYIGDFVVGAGDY